MAASSAQLPGEELVSAGLVDLRAGRLSQEALLVAMAATRLRAAGLDVPAVVVDSPSHELYRLLAREHGTAAHGRYNALVRRIVSYARAAERAAAR